MNLPVIFTKIWGACKGFGGNSLLLAKKHAPELMIGAGIGGFGLTIFETVKATNNTNELIEQRDQHLGMIESTRSAFTEAEYSTKDYQHDLAIVNRQTKWAIVKTWAPVATRGLASTASILGGFKIVNGRLVATTAAYKVLENRIDHYRSNVIERFGKDVDWELEHSIKAETLEAAEREREENRRIDAENKGRKIIRKRKKTEYSHVYDGIFDQYSDKWQRYWTPEMALEFVKQKQRELNDMLKINKHVFLNEAYDKLGLPRTSEGAVVGWILTHGNPDSFVSLGIDEMPEEEIRQILCTHRNDDIRIKIRTNPDGLIYDLIDKGCLRVSY